jgi:hypothetical protein
MIEANLIRARKPFRSQRVSERLWLEASFGGKWKHPTAVALTKNQ